MTVGQKSHQPNISTPLYVDILATHFTFTFNFTHKFSVILFLYLVLIFHVYTVVHQISKLHSNMKTNVITLS